MLRIALTADPELPVPPKLYGGIERIVDFLARGLAARGHDVTVFAHPESSTSGRLVPWPGKASRNPMDTARNTAALARHVLAERFDVVHSFSRMAYLAPLLPLPIPKLMTYQRAINRNSVRMGALLSRGSLWYSVVSERMMDGVGRGKRWRVISNGVSLDTYQFKADPGADAPFVFLGRVAAIKGPHLAIEAARRAGVPLVIAGNVPPEHQRWFDQHIAPHICGERVRYVGPLDDAGKNELLGRARALLMPILWDEPFGIVMIEAMACGTPVIGLARGSVPEVIEDGVTGFVVDDLAEMAAAIEKIETISR
ncbi:MAG: glycosyltransferase family 4 protein, partial [Gammaproteobacteria bacterium]|nr:glycosyltransferase family 4 protein [Gammaproteobacteria bacterium]